LSAATLDDVNLSGLQIGDANLRGASIVDSMTDGMTIDGVAVEDLMAAYRSSKSLV